MVLAVFLKLHDGGDDPDNSFYLRRLSIQIIDIYPRLHKEELRDGRQAADVNFTLSL